MNGIKGFKLHRGIKTSALDGEGGFRSFTIMSMMIEKENFIFDERKMQN